MTQAVFLYSTESCTLSITKFYQTKSLNITFKAFIVAIFCPQLYSALSSYTHLKVILTQE